MARKWHIVAVAVAVGITGAIALALRERGAAPRDIADARLDVTPRELAKALPTSHVDGHEVEVRFRHDVPDFEEAQFVFATRGAQHVTGVWLVRTRENEEQARKAGHRDDLDGRFATRLPNANQNELWRGNVRFWLSEHELAFEVKVIDNEITPTRTDAQVAMARDVLVSIAFGIPVKHSDREIADTLGTGYPVADVAGVAVTSKSSGLDAITTHFPGATHSAGSVLVPLVHPLVEDVELTWRIGRGGVEYLHVDFHMTGAFRGPGTFAACIAKQPVSSLLQVRDIGLGTVDEVTDPKTFASLLQAVDACR